MMMILVFLLGAAGGMMCVLIWAILLGEDNTLANQQSIANDRLRAVEAREFRNAVVSGNYSRKLSAEIHDLEKIKEKYDSLISETEKE